MGKFINKLTVNLHEICARDKVHQHLFDLLRKQEGLKIRPIIILCIGSDRYTGDSLGPLIGSDLKENTEFTVYGCLDYPVHAGNLVETISVIKHRHHHPIIIAIDACLGKTSEIGNIEVWEGGLQAGIAVGNRLPCVGDISVIGVVNSGGHLGYLDLQSTPLSIVVKLSKVISFALRDAVPALAVESEKQVLSC
ncbi:hypothetical protein SDC9_08920 [bioreactor metagenome]|uniref:Spore protease YyaC n=1 Tax=bioreactor metagenome TaxID=1076179 RepID=A0A644T8R0_9ZZZZ|nr:spore protease YyaC [Negativicutes bacterium]